MRSILAVCLFPLSLCPAAGALPAKAHKVASAGLQLTIPAAWHADRNMLLSCDPERLLLVSSSPIRTARTGGLLPPGKGQVLIGLVEDHVNLPAGNLHRPSHFTVAWNRLIQLDGGGCGSPRTPVAAHFFHTHGRYLGFDVYPGPGVSTQTRRQTLAVMDSLQVTGQSTLP
jgi:hypothetical protein